MMTEETFSIVTTFMNVMATLFVIAVGVGVLVVIVLFVLDVTQTKSAIRRNYPVVGRFRYFFEHLGEFFRQYFFAMDREEMPFNRAQRSWVYRAAKNIDNTVGFKAVIGAYGWLDGLFAEVNERGIESAPDFITVDGADGGTGAAPMPLIDDVGLPLRESLPLLVDKLNEYGLRERTCVIASAKLVTPTDVAWALCMGADFIVSARGFMFALGCIQALQCNKNTCPTGITTHNRRLQRGLNPEDKAVRVANYARNITHEVGIIAHACGVREPRELKRFHARIVGSNGLSVPLNELHPDVTGPGSVIHVA